MKGERIAAVSPYQIGAESIRRLIESMPEDRHQIVAVIDSPQEIRKLRNLDQRPTVIIVQDFKYFEDTQRAVRLSKALFPNTHVITFGVDKVIEEADHQLGLTATRDDLKKLLLSLKH